MLIIFIILTVLIIVNLLLVVKINQEIKKEKETFLILLADKIDYLHVKWLSKPYRHSLGHFCRRHWYDNIQLRQINNEQPPKD